MKRTYRGVGFNYPDLVERVRTAAANGNVQAQKLIGVLDGNIRSRPQFINTGNATNTTNGLCPSCGGFVGGPLCFSICGPPPSTFVCPVCRSSGGHLPNCVVVNEPARLGPLPAASPSAPPTPDGLARFRLIGEALLDEPEPEQ